MRTIKLTVEYDGTEFHGWQRQRGVRTVEGTLEEALRDVFGEDVDLAGASRTDRGVHAAAQVASLRTGSTLPGRGLAPALNRRLPGDVRVLRADDASEEFHARHDAVGKHYRYLVLTRGQASVFLRRYVHCAREPLDVSIMREAASLLVGEHDFASFRSSSGGAPDAEASTVRSLHTVCLEEEGPFLVMDFRGRSFLYKMVRTLAGTLLEVGRGAWTPSRVESALKGADRRLAGPTAPACGLSLVSVYYDPAEYQRDLSTRLPVLLPLSGTVPGTGASRI
jgi:tRNA pseudouridine38-40 synthase